jgi:hypothetical protein
MRLGRQTGNFLTHSEALGANAFPPLLHQAKGLLGHSFPDLSPVLATSQAFEPICFELDDASAFGTEAVHNRADIASGSRVLRRTDI